MNRAPQVMEAVSRRPWLLLLRPMKLVRAMRLGFGIGGEAFFHRRPFLLYLKPTPRCDLRCATCNRWQDRPDRREEMTLTTIKGVLAKFWRAGCKILTLWGGEPTLRRDLGEILSEAKRLGFKTSICTNGNHLATRATEILPHLDVLLCSLDGDRAVHDEIRGVHGLFDRVIRGIEIAGGYPDCEIKIWASVHRRDQDQLASLANLAAAIKVGIEFFPITPIPGYNDALVLDPQARSDVFGEIRRLKHQGLPVRNSERALKLMQTGAPFVCNFGRISIHVDHRGMVYSCESAAGDPLHTWGDHDRFDPEAVFASDAFHDVAARLRSCERCRLPCVMELSNNLTRSLAGMFLKAI
jgi:MoaA/NifB/PqqE/SkfB family radical SAM enzyme